MIEPKIIKAGLIFGFLAFPTLFRRPSKSIWVTHFIMNGLINHLLDTILVTTKNVTYPKRFMPKIFKINVIYDYLVCTYLSVWFSQLTYNAKLPEILGKALLFTVPQASYEILLERKTDALKFKRNWKWYYSMVMVYIVKLISRGMLSLLKLSMKKNDHPKTHLQYN